jgi:Peroxide stress protein YaaA
MTNLIIIPCSSCKDPINVGAFPPAGMPDVLNMVNPGIAASLTAYRLKLCPLAGIAPGGFSPAYQRYSGVYAWQYNSFPIGNWLVRANPQTHVVIVSAYYGLLNPYSYIPFYDLHMKKHITIPPGIAYPGYIGLVKNFWLPILRSALIDYCQLNAITHIDNLLTNDYCYAIQLDLGIPGVIINHNVWNDNYGHHRGRRLGANL